MITKVQNTSSNTEQNSGGAGTTATQTFSGTPVVGNAVIVMVSFETNFAPQTVTGVTDNQTGNTYSLVKRQTDNTGGDGDACECWWCPALVNSSGTFTVTVTYSISGTATAQLGTIVNLIEVSGLAGTTDSNGIAGGNLGGTGTTITVSGGGNNATAAAFEVAMCAVNFNTTGISNPPTGWNTVYVDSGAGRAQQGSYRIASVVETTSATWSWTGTQGPSALVATFDGAAGATASIAWIV
jgi:hypothetical protein